MLEQPEMVNQQPSNHNMIEGSTTIPQGSTPEWVEKGNNIKYVEDIVLSLWKHKAVHKRTGKQATRPTENK